MERLSARIDVECYIGLMSWALVVSVFSDQVLFGFVSNVYGT